MALILASPLVAQERQMVLQSGHTMRIEGTSNLRDWGADVGQLAVDFAVRDWSENPITDLAAEIFTSFALRAPVADIHSRTKGLTGKIHKYLKKKEHPIISFELHRVTDIRIAADIAHVCAEGTIRAAGADHRLVLDAALTAGAADTLLVSGRTRLNMTDFGIKPPTALFGTIRAVDAFEVSFSLPFVPRTSDHAGLH
ncbi:MAG: YceI family protein [Candidatus Latescibacteria bacterium]|nr:YceI family protein [Candidatus Latescibacterota bacterium]